MTTKNLDSAVINGHTSSENFLITIPAIIITLKIKTLTALGSIGGKAPRPPRPLKLSSRRLDLLPRVKVIIFFVLIEITISSS